MPSSRGSSQPRHWTQVSSIVGRFFTVWATREAQPGIKPGLPAFGAWSLNHWTTREVPLSTILMRLQTIYNHVCSSHYISIRQDWFRIQLVFDTYPFSFGPLVFTHLFSPPKGPSQCALFFSLRSESFAGEWAQPTPNRLISTPLQAVSYTDFGQKGNHFISLKKIPFSIQMDIPHCGFFFKLKFGLE